MLRSFLGLESGLRGQTRKYRNWANGSLELSSTQGTDFQIQERLPLQSFPILPVIRLLD